MTQGVELERPPGVEATDPGNARDCILDPFVLPTREEIDRVFGGEKDAVISDMDNSLDTLYYRRLDGDQFEVLNQEFVTALAGYLIEQADVIREDSDEAVSILEAGAGIGKLSRFLKFFFDEAGEDGIDLTAVDSGQSSLTSALGPNVETMDYREGLDRYRPSIVICSWMPLGEDWTQAMRDTPSVQEYVLIGEGHFGCCGDQWQTWGNPLPLIDSFKELIENASEEDKAVYEAKINELDTAAAPSETDGFSRHSLKDLSELQTDVHRSVHSETVSFRRDTPS